MLKQCRYLHIPRELNPLLSICMCIERNGVSTPWLEKMTKPTIYLTLYLIETPFNAFANRAGPDQAALVRTTWSGSTLFAYGWKYDISDPTIVDLTSNFFALCTIHESLFI